MNDSISLWNPDTNALMDLKSNAFDKQELEWFAKNYPNYHKRMEFYKKAIIDTHDHVHVIILNMMEKDI